MTEDQSAFSHELRIRVCGVLVRSDAVLLTQVHSPITDNLVWMPPGGGLKFGESMEECLKREFREETSIIVKAGPLIHLNELLSPPYHAIECFFEVSKVSGEPKLGSDPELPHAQQLLNDLRWTPLNELDTLSFAPQSFIEKLHHWDQRFGFPIR